MSQGVLKVVLHTGLNVYKQSCRGFPLITNSFLLCYKWSQTRSILCSSFIFHVTFTKVSAILIQNNYIYCWGIKIKESPQYKLYDNIGDLSKTTSWNRSNGTKRNPWVMLFSHCAVNELLFTLHLCYNPLFTYYCLSCSYVTTLLVYCRG